MKQSMLNAFALAALLLGACNKQLDDGTNNTAVTPPPIEKGVMATSSEIQPQGDNIANKITLPVSTIGNNYELAFADDFNADKIDEGCPTTNGVNIVGAYNPAMWWMPRTGTKVITHPADQVQFTTVDKPANATVANSLLSLQMAFNSAEGTNMTGGLSGGAVISKAKFGYGYYVIRVKLYTGCAGFHQSFWQTCEAFNIDMFEFFSRTHTTSSELDFNIHNNFKNFEYVKLQMPGTHYATNMQDFNQARDNSNTGFIEYAYEWTPGKMRLFVNGVYKGWLDVNSVPDAEIYGNYDNTNYTKLLSMYVPGRVWLSGKTYRDFITVSPQPPIDQAYSKMQVDYFAYYHKKVNNINLLGNPSFEYTNQFTAPGLLNNGNRQDSSHGWVMNKSLISNYNGTTTQYWAQSGGAYIKRLTDAANGNIVLQLEKNNALAYQTLNYIPNGKYTLKAKIRCTSYSAYTSTDNWPTIEVLNIYHSKENKLGQKIIENTYLNNWQDIIIENINVANNYAAIIIRANGASSDWFQVDDLRFERISD